MHLCETCVRYSSTRLTCFEDTFVTLEEEFKGFGFVKFIISDVVHIASPVKIDLFLWNSTLRLINKTDT